MDTSQTAETPIYHGNFEQALARPATVVIAATAHVHDARLYTRNSADLKSLKNHLEIVTV